MAIDPETGTFDELKREISDLRGRLEKVIRLTTSAQKRIETVKAIEVVRKLGFTTRDESDRPVDVVQILTAVLADLDKAETVADLIPF